MRIFTAKLQTTENTQELLKKWELYTESKNQNTEYRGKTCMLLVYAQNHTGGTNVFYEAAASYGL